MFSYRHTETVQHQPACLISIIYYEFCFRYRYVILPWFVRESDNGEHVYITTSQPDTTSNLKPNPNPTLNGMPQ